MSVLDLDADMKPWQASHDNDLPVDWERTRKNDAPKTKGFCLLATLHFLKRPRQTSRNDWFTEAILTDASLLTAPPNHPRLYAYHSPHDHQDTTRTGAGPGVGSRPTPDPPIVSANLFHPDFQYLPRDPYLGPIIKLIEENAPVFIHAVGLTADSLPPNAEKPHARVGLTGVRGGWAVEIFEVRETAEGEGDLEHPIMLWTTTSHDGEVLDDTLTRRLEAVRGEPEFKEALKREYLARRQHLRLPFSHDILRGVSQGPGQRSGLEPPGGGLSCSQDVRGAGSHGEGRGGGEEWVKGGEARTGDHHHLHRQDQDSLCDADIIAAAHAAELARAADRLRRASEAGPSGARARSGTDPGTSPPRPSHPPPHPTTTAATRIGVSPVRYLSDISWSSMYDQYVLKEASRRSVGSMGVSGPPIVVEAPPVPEIDVLILASRSGSCGKKYLDWMVWDGSEPCRDHPTLGQASAANLEAWTSSHEGAVSSPGSSRGLFERWELLRDRRPTVGQLVTVSLSDDHPVYQQLHRQQKRWVAHGVTLCGFTPTLINGRPVLRPVAASCAIKNVSQGSRDFAQRMVTFLHALPVQPTQEAEPLGDRAEGLGVLEEGEGGEDFERRRAAGPDTTVTRVVTEVARKPPPLWEDGRDATATASAPATSCPVTPTTEGPWGLTVAARAAAVMAGYRTISANRSRPHVSVSVAMTSARALGVQATGQKYRLRCTVEEVSRWYPSVLEDEDWLASGYTCQNDDWPRCEMTLVDASGKDSMRVVVLGPAFRALLLGRPLPHGPRAALWRHVCGLDRLTWDQEQGVLRPVRSGRHVPTSVWKEAWVDCTVEAVWGAAHFALGTPATTEGGTQAPTVGVTFRLVDTLALFY